MTAPPTGLLVVDKPPQMSSHAVVARVRRVLGTRRVGHAGTLDPMATGVLVLGVGLSLWAGHEGGRIRHDELRHGVNPVIIADEEPGS